MIEHEWRDCSDPFKMLLHLKGTDWGRGRKMRLFAAACCRRVWHRLTDERSRAAVIVAERYADGECSEADRESARQAAMAAMLESPRGADGDHAWALRGELVSLAAAEEISAYLLMWLFNDRAQGQNPVGEATEKEAQAHLLRELVGPLPFRSITIAPSWRAAAVLGVARDVYAERAFDRLAALADALEDAGCEHPDIVSHCRSSGPHVPGCWVVDLVLDKV